MALEHNYTIEAKVPTLFESEQAFARKEAIA